MKLKSSFIFVLVLTALLPLSAVSGEIRRTHQFLRPLAMGGAFTAVADSMETIAYNPAGVLQKDVEWSMSIPIIGFTMNELMRDIVLDASGDIGDKLGIDFDDASTYDNVRGKRLFIEFRVPALPLVFLPDSGIYSGLSANFWFEFVVPKQSIIPTVHIELITQAVYEYAMAFEIFKSGWFAGGNLKLINRVGVVDDVGLLVLSNLDADDLLDKSGAGQPPLKLAFDLGLLYRFDHRWNPRIGISSLDVGSVDVSSELNAKYGGIDYGVAGEVKQLNSIGFAVTQQIDKIYLTYSADFHDYSFSYFPNNSIMRRIALGFEIAFYREPDNASIAALQIGIRELRYPSWGYSLAFGFLKFSAAQWIENYGTETNPVTDQRTIFLISLDF